MTKEDKDPKNGWLVVCIGLGHYSVSNSREGLANVIGMLNEKQIIADTSLPVQVFELGKEVSVGVDYIVKYIKPRDE